jgi:FKBP-type peptidyl-prolyl cis-trans isomerase (trigger factor)
MTSTDIEISPLILDAEVNRRLTSLYEEIKKLGLTVEQYLESKKLTAASLREKLTEETKDLYKSEFLLEQIADKEQITVDKTDLDKVFKQAKSKEEEALYKNNSYLYTRLLRKQKTLDFLANL